MLTSHKNHLVPILNSIQSASHWLYRTQSVKFRFHETRDVADAALKSIEAKIAENKIKAEEIQESKKKKHQIGINRDGLQPKTPEIATNTNQIGINKEGLQPKAPESTTPKTSPPVKGFTATLSTIATNSIQEMKTASQTKNSLSKKVGASIQGVAALAFAEANIKLSVAHFYPSHSPFPPGTTNWDRVKWFIGDRTTAGHQPSKSAQLIDQSK